MYFSVQESLLEAPGGKSSAAKPRCSSVRPRTTTIVSTPLVSTFSVAGWAVAKPWIKTGMFSKWPTFRVPLEIPGLAVPLVTVRGAPENKGLAVESCLDGKGFRRESCSRCCERSRMSTLISQRFMRNGLV